MTHHEGGGEFFRRRIDKFPKRIFIPVHKTFFRWFLLHRLGFATFCGGFGIGFEIGDDVFRCLRDDVADVVETATPGASGDLFEVPDGERFGGLSAVFEKLGEDDRADRDVDADAQCIGSANDFEQAFLREFFYECSVFGEQSGVVDAEAVTQEFLISLP